MVSEDEAIRAMGKYIGLMLGIRQPLDGPIFEKLEDAQNWCIHAMISHYDRRLGMSDAKIEPFQGMV